MRDPVISRRAPVAGGNKYVAEVKAVQKIEGKKKPKVLAKAKIQLGKY